MFRELRRPKQLLSEELTIHLLQNGITGILAVLGDNAYPYAVPINYVYDDNKIYFHCAKKGHKMDAIQNHDKVCFTVISKDTIVPEQFTTYFESVIVFGKATIIEDTDIKLHAMKLLNQKYAPAFEKQGDQEVKQALNALGVVQIEIEHMSGKQAKALVKKD